MIVHRVDTRSKELYEALLQFGCQYTCDEVDDMYYREHDGKTFYEWFTTASLKEKEEFLISIGRRKRKSTDA